MKIKLAIILLTMIFSSCVNKTENYTPKTSSVPLQGTWQLLKGIVIDKGDTVVTDYTKNVAFIKIINDTHFAFLQHDLNKGKDANAVFASGGGHYSLSDSLYTEHLEYCSDRNWEGNDFNFTVTIKNDTLTQRGIEKVEGTGINRINIEKYIRLKS